MMRDLEKYAAECMLELDNLKIKYGKNIRFKVNKRAKSRLGVCKKTGDFYVIEISAFLLDERSDLKNGLKDTIMHELLHTCRGCMKHTGMWKELAQRVNAAYGYNIRRVASPADNAVPAELLPKPKYIVKCENCGLELARQKRSALVAHPDRYRCGKCRGRLRLIQK